ncbi:MAG TPA: hypothetical protein VKR21_19275 [Solirubrobacteraceae bacterium]|nr:hypothetical protein [Solirubrobacteraceae bacterium]
MLPPRWQEGPGTGTASSGWGRLMLTAPEIVAEAGAAAELAATAVGIVEDAGTAVAIVDDAGAAIGVAPFTGITHGVSEQLPAPTKHVWLPGASGARR